MQLLAIVLQCCSLDSIVAKLLIAKLLADSKLKSLTNYVSRAKWLPTSFQKILAKNSVICYHHCILIGNSPQKKKKMNNNTFYGIFSRKRENPSCFHVKKCFCIVRNSNESVNSCSRKIHAQKQCLAFHTIMFHFSSTMWNLIHAQFLQFQRFRMKSRKMLLIFHSKA